MTDGLVLVTPAELAALVRGAVDAALAEREPDVGPVLLDRSGLARALGCSVATVNRLRLEPDFPELRLVDAPRFVLADVLAWLSARSASARCAHVPESTGVVADAPEHSGTAIVAAAPKCAKPRRRKGQAQ